MLLCESIVENMFSLGVGLRRIEIGIRLSVRGVKDWILVRAQISERLFIEKNALQGGDQTYRRRLLRLTKAPALTPSRNLRRGLTTSLNFQHE